MARPLDRYLRAHPDETVEEAAELAKLRGMLAVISLSTAATDPAVGACLAHRLHTGRP
jgi:hypothetical protein